MKIAYTLCLIGATTLTSQAVLLNFSGRSSDTITQFGDNTGALVPGLTWGLLIDGAGDGFADLATLADRGAFVGQTLANGNFGGSGDTLVLSDNLTLENRGNVVATALSASFSADLLNSPAKLIWFDNVAAGETFELGDFVGVSTTTSTTPTDDSFSGVEAAFYGDNGAASIAIVPVPEPSTALLGLLGLAGVLRRRR